MSPPSSTGSATITAAVFGAVTDWTRPMLTFYDDATGERTELSAATLGNWAAKTANFVVDEVGAVPGDVIVVDLPHHWQTAAILLGCWWAGAHVRFGGAGDDEAVAVFTSVDRSGGHRDARGGVATSLDPFALPVRNLPPGVTDFSTAVRVHGDNYAARARAEAALDDATTAEVLAAALAGAASAGVTAGARVLSTRTWADADAATAALVSVLARGASLVSVANADPDGIERRAQTERATLILR